MKQGRFCDGRNQEMTTSSRYGVCFALPELTLQIRMFCVLNKRT